MEVAQTRAICDIVMTWIKLLETKTSWKSNNEDKEKMSDTRSQNNTTQKQVDEKWYFWVDERNIYTLTNLTPTVNGRNFRLPQNFGYAKANLLFSLFKQSLIINIYIVLTHIHRHVYTHMHKHTHTYGKLHIIFISICPFKFLYVRTSNNLCLSLFLSVSFSILSLSFSLSLSL